MGRNITEKVSKMKNQKNIFDSGKVIKIKDYIIEVSGLENVMYFEKVIIMDKGIGYINAIYENSVSVAIVKEEEKIEIGDIVNPTREIFKAVFSKESIGKIVNIFGIDQLSGNKCENYKYIDIEKPNIPVIDRGAVTRPLLTGIAGIDLLYPIGKGQRQLILGDKKTGKTQIALDTIVHQGEVAEKGTMVCIYIAIGKTKKEIKTIYNELLNRNALDYTMMLVSTNDDKLPIMSLIPYVGMSMAEDYMMSGKDVLVVIDDLRYHAEIYREVSLNAKKTPGREAYPADIFYAHSRLLEKGCQYKNGGSITILPILETKSEEIIDYISSNIISITDGQIVLSNDAFLKGQKPAIDYGISVSRLGSTVQVEEIKKMGAQVRLKLLNYLENKKLYKNDAINEIGEEIRNDLKEGRKIEMLLRQEKFEAFSIQDIIDRFEDFE